MTVGSLIVLNGTSCSGKTTTALALQEHLAEPYLYVGLDTFEAMQPVKNGQRIHVFYGQAADRTLHEDRELLHVMHQCVAALAAEGANVIVEHIFLYHRWLKDAIHRFNDYPVLFVRVQCALHELERREREREGRDPSSGQAANHYRRLGLMDRDVVYDVTVNTGELTIGECVHRIETATRERSIPTAFQRMHAAAFLDEPGP